MARGLSGAEWAGGYELQWTCQEQPHSKTTARASEPPPHPPSRVRSLLLFSLVYIKLELIRMSIYLLVTHPVLPLSFRPHLSLPLRVRRPNLPQVRVRRTLLANRRTSITGALIRTATSEISHRCLLLPVAATFIISPFLSALCNIRFPRSSNRPIGPRIEPRYWSLRTLKAH